MSSSDEKKLLEIMHSKSKDLDDSVIQISGGPISIIPQSLEEFKEIFNKVAKEYDCDVWSKFISERTFRRKRFDSFEEFYDLMKGMRSFHDFLKFAYNQYGDELLRCLIFLYGYLFVGEDETRKFIKEYGVSGLQSFFQEIADEEIYGFPLSIEWVEKFTGHTIYLADKRILDIYPFIWGIHLGSERKVVWEYTWRGLIEDMRVSRLTDYSDEKVLKEYYELFPAEITLSGFEEIILFNLPKEKAKEKAREWITSLTGVWEKKESVFVYIDFMKEFERKFSENFRVEFIIMDLLELLRKQKMVSLYLKKQHILSEVKVFRNLRKGFTNMIQFLPGPFPKDNIIAPTIKQKDRIMNRSFETLGAVFREKSRYTEENIKYEYVFCSMESMLDYAI